MITRRRAPALEGRHRRRRHARSRPGDGRDDRRRARHRLGPADHGQRVRLRRLDAGGDRLPSGARPTTSALGADRHGPTLFLLTILVNLAATAIVSRSTRRMRALRDRRPSIPGGRRRRCARARRPVSTPASSRTLVMTLPDGPASWSCVVLLLVLVHRGRQGLLDRSRFPDWFTEDIPPRPPAGPGMKPAIVGTSSSPARPR